MKTYAWIVAVLMVAMVRLASGAEIQVVAADGFPPTQYAEGDHAAGVAVDVALAVLDEAGYEARAVAMPWSRAQALALNRGAVITGFSRTEARERQGFLFSDPLFSVPVVLVVRHDNRLPFTGPADLAGHTIGVAAYSSYGETFERLRHAMALAEVETNDELRLRMLLNGRIDFGIFSGGAAVLDHAQRTYGLDPADFRVLSPPLVDDVLHMATGKATPAAAALMARVNAAIARLTRNGAITALTARMGASATP